MYISKSILITCMSLSIAMCFSATAFAETKTASIEFFSSNNTQEISIENAFKRLTGKEQHELQKNLVTVLQHNHIEQGKFENILGTYEMASDKKVTGDNTEIFYASPLQNFSQKQIFSLAIQIANTLGQESVAVFIPANQYSIGDIQVKFSSDKPSITDAINMIQKKLPAAYATAFSLHLNNKHAGFEQARVTQIEWLGSKIKIDEIKKAFPQEKISYQYGQAYLVYKNGKIELI